MKSASDLRTFPISAGLLDPKHVQALDPSSPLWVYLWLVNRVTRDEPRGEDFIGIVLNGRPLRIHEIAIELGIEYHSCRRHLAHLVKTGYVERTKTAVGMFTYVVDKSKKFIWKRQSRVGRNQVANPLESTPSLFSKPTETTEQNLHAGNKPQSKICNSQIVDSAQCNKRNARAVTQSVTKKSLHIEPGFASLSPVLETKPASDLTDQVLRIASEHPRLEHLKGRPLSRIQEQVIVEAIVRDGFDRVLEGTRVLRDAVGHWPLEEHRYAPNPEKFFQNFEYLKKASDWERSNNASTKPSVAQQRQQRARAVLTAAITDRIGPDVGSSGRHDGARADGARERPLDEQARLRGVAGD